MDSTMECTMLTILRESHMDSKRSVPSSCCPRLNSVSVTDRAFFENHKVNTIMPPAMSSNVVWDCTFLLSATMVMFSGSLEAAAVWYAFNPAKGTPIKFTKSFAAKAMASAKVPTSTTGFRIFILNKEIKI